MKPLSIVVAVDTLGGFGKDGKIPWDIPEDLQRFKEITAGGICIMGKNTYLDIRERRYKTTLEDFTKSESKALTEIPDLLPGRQCYVISKSLFTKNNYSPGTNVRVPGNVFVKKSLRGVVEGIDRKDQRQIFILGGEKLFWEAWCWTTIIHMTIIKGEPFDCDRFFPVKHIAEEFKIVTGTKTDKVYNVQYRRFKNAEESKRG